MKYLKLKWTLAAAVLLTGIAVVRACIIPAFPTVCVPAGTVVANLGYMNPCGYQGQLITGGNAYAPAVTTHKCGGSRSTVRAVYHNYVPVYGFETSPWDCALRYVSGYAIISCTGQAPGGASCNPCPAIAL